MIRELFSRNQASEVLQHRLQSIRVIHARANQSLKMNILYIADPHTIHDINWIGYFGADADCHCFLICLKKQYQRMSERNFRELESKNIHFLGYIDNFSVRRPAIILKNMSSLKKWISNHEIDLIHVIYAEPNILWASFRSYLDTPFVLSTRGTDILKTIPEIFAKSGLYFFMLRKIFRFAANRFDLITCTSHAQSARVSELFCRESTIIRTGVDWINIEEAHRNYEVFTLQDIPYVFFPRLMRPIYNHELALKAICLLPEKLRKKYRFIFVGSDGEDREYVTKISKQISGVEAKIEFLPTLSEMHIYQHYQHADLVVHTPMSDGSPVSVMEAMAFSKPVIIPPLCYDQEIFSKCITFPQYNFESLAVTMEMALEKKKYSAKDLEINREIVKRNCNRRHEMLKLKSHYKDLISVK